jgi:hypothetical protein
MTATEATQPLIPHSADVGSIPGSAFTLTGLENSYHNPLTAREVKRRTPEPCWVR